MFARPLSSAHVCLGCQLRRVRHNSRTLSSILLHRSSLAVSCIRSLHSSPPSRWTVPLAGVFDNHLIPFRKVQSPFLQEKYQAPRSRSKFRRGKKGGQEVREDAEALSVNSLGKPAEVIVLRDTGRDAEEFVEQEEDEESKYNVQGSSREAMLEAMEKEAVPMDQETVNQQIDALRPRLEDPNSGRLVISSKEVLRLCKVITDSYSFVQISAYIARSKAPPEHASSKDVIRSLIVNKSPDLHFRPWTPTNKGIIPDSYHGLNKKYLHPKAKIVKRIKLARTLLKQCWRVEIEEEVEQLGELVCTLPTSGIRLLNAGSE